MNLLKFILVAGLIFYGVYWVSTTGVALWRSQKIQDAVNEYRENEGYYPLALEELTAKRRVNGEIKRYLMELPVPRQGYCWDYNKDDGRVQLSRYEGDRSNIRACP